MGRTIKDSSKICSYRLMYCTISCYQRKQVIADFIKQRIRPNIFGRIVLCKVLLMGHKMCNNVFKR